MVNILSYFSHFSVSKITQDGGGKKVDKFIAILINYLIVIRQLISHFSIILQL